MTEKLLPKTPTPEMLSRAVAFALNVKIGSTYGWTEYMRDLWETMSIAAPVASQSSVPDGWKLVPVEPTIDMMFMGVSEWSVQDDPEEDVHGVWEAMLKAAPKFGEEE